MTTAGDRSPFRHEPGLDFRAPEQHGVFEEAVERVRFSVAVTRSSSAAKRSTGMRRSPRANPARPGEVVGRHPVARGEDVGAAAMAAAAAFPEWSQTPTEARAALMFDVADRIVAQRHEFAAS